MGEPTAEVQPTRSREALAVAGLVVTLAGAVSWPLLLDNPSIRSTAWTVWTAIVAGNAMIFAALFVDRRRRILGIAAPSVIISSLFILSWLTVLNVPAASALSNQAPDFTLLDHTGTPVSLAEARSKGPVLLVFYRGHW